MKKYNFNEFGRYRGGVPRPFGIGRGDALGQPGEFHKIDQIKEFEMADEVSDFKVARFDVVEFGRYMKDDEVNYKARRTYIVGNIDADYFSIGKLSWGVYIIAALAVIQASAVLLKDINQLQGKRGKTVLGIE